MKLSASRGSSISADDTIQCTDAGGAQFSVGEQYLVAMDTTARLGLLEAADIIFVVDESGSMIGEHKWLKQLVFELENSLRLAEVGSSPSHPNMYALVGFARDEDSARGGVIIQDLGTPQQLISALEQLALTGIFEDGYSGIDVALSGISTRPGTAKQIILVTDEHRSVLNFRLSRENMAGQLQRDGFKLNVVVNQGFEAGDRSIMGIDSTGMGYIYNSSDSNFYTQVANGHADMNKSFKSTNEDYIELALQLGGGAWDLNLLRVDQNMTTAFTNAFVSVKIEEILSTFRTCFRCHCGSSNSQCIRTIIPLGQCRGPIINVAVDPVVVVSPQTAQRPFGSPITFQCLTHPVSVSDPIVWYRWYHTLVGDITPPPLATNSSLVLESVSFDDTGHYVCEIETRNGVRRSANATLSVYAPSISTLVTPHNPDVIVGDTVVFTCSIDLPIPVDQFIWTLNGVNLPANAEVSSNDTHSSLTVTNFEAANTGVYHCRAIVDVVSSSSSPSDILVVKILDNSNVTVSVGEPATFTCSSRCVDTSVVCVGVVAEWTRRDEDELPTTASVFTGYLNSTLHFPATNSEDAGEYVCTGRIFNFIESSIAFLTVATVPVAMVIEANVSVTRGQLATLQCTSTGSPQPECSFYKADDENMEVIATGIGAVDLIIANTQPSDAGSYVCKCSNSKGTSQASATILVDCVVRQVEILAHLETAQLCDADVPEGTPTGACVVFIVDESRSMVGEHRWLMEFSQILEDQLNEAGIGLGDLPNRYGLVGFGARSYVHSRVIELTGDGEEISNVKTLEYGIKRLELTGRNEDGYAGIETAHQLIMRHPQCLASNIARQFILVTDEERDVVVADLNRSVIYSHISEFDGRLNIAVSEAFECKNGPGPYDFEEVLGLDSNGTGYSETTNGNVEPLSDCQPKPDSGYVTTNEDYTQLAFQLGGGAWNLNQLRQGGNKARAFTTAFLTVKVEEVIDQLKCVTCLCSSGELMCGQEVTKSEEST